MTPVSRSPSQGDGRVALVTGATSGIGRALSEALAARGFTIHLVARDRARLESVAAHLQEQTGRAAQPHVCDLEHPPQVAALCDRLEAGGIVPEILVNNAGFSVHGPFATTPLDRELALVDLQIKAALILIKRLLPAMLARRSGRILNVASVYAFASVPRQAVYASSKAFLQAFSAALSVELEGSGVSVTSLCPGITTTELRMRAGRPEKPTRLAMSAEAVAEAGCRALLRGRRTAVPGLVNRAYVLATHIVPRRLVARATRRLNLRRGLESTP